MRKVWNHNDWIIWAAGIGLTMFCYVLGLNHVSGAGGGQPPPCPANPCACKVVKYWQPPGMPMAGAFQTGSMRITNPTAMLNINTGSGGCQNNPLVPNGKFDRWDIATGGINCTPPPNNILITEVSVNPEPPGVNRGTLQANQQANLCSP